MASVYVRGFPKRTGQRDLEKCFSEIGSVNEVRMVRDFAFIVFKDREKAKEAVDKMNGQNFDGQVLTVELSKERSGPQPNDVCRSCGKKGHWQTNCPNNRNRYYSSQLRRRGRSSSRSYSSRSRSASSQSRQKRKKHKKSSKKHSKKRYARSESSDSSDSSSSSRSRSRSHSSKSSKSADKKKGR